MLDGKLQFTPVGVGRAGEEIFLQIEAAILDGRLSPGDRLPSERELQSQFGTGRGVVREALKALKQKGLVDIRKGAKGGAFVKQMEVGTVSESLALFLRQNSIAPERVVEFRESMDRSVTSLAVVRGGADDRAALLEEARELRRLSASGATEMETLVEMDRRLNLRLARMSGNPVFEWVMRAMQTGFGSYDYALYANEGYRTATAVNWEDTACAINEADPLRALSFVSNHYVLLRRRMAEQDAGDLAGFMA